MLIKTYSDDDYDDDDSDEKILAIIILLYLCLCKCLLLYFRNVGNVVISDKLSINFLAP